MNKRELGRSGISVAPLALGGNVFGWTADERTSFEILDAFVDAGFDLIDTADVYTAWIPGHKGGESESVLGRWFKKSGKRAKVTLATKVGMPVDGGKGLRKPRIRAAIEASLRRLQTDVVDLYQAHLDDAETPLEETLAAFADLVQEGKVRALGASNYAAPRLAAALEISARAGLPRYDCLQPLYNLCERADYEAALGPLCVEKKVGVIPYFALASGFLTGKYRSAADLAKSARGPRVEKYLNERGFRILKALDAAAAALGQTPGRVARAWLSAKPGVTAPIASATSLAQLRDLVAATRLALPAEIVAALDRASA
jgi:aryl-alcohol dehydrogenase-like predicted oxidoreductase